EPGSETYVMINREMVATYEGISGQAIFLSAKDKLETQVPRVSRTLQRMVKPGKHYQIFNPSNQRTRLIQRYEPFWQPDKSFIKIGPKIIPGRDLWFERHEVLNRLNSGLKYKFIEQMPGIIELKLRIEPGLKSICEYYRYSTHYFKVTQGAGIMTIDGKKHILKMADEINIPPGSKFQFQNPFPDRWEMTLFLKPGWIPEESFYEREGKLIPGTDVWFEIKID
ncbi:MAG: hypothetical protein MUF15_11280, partial [Acidobacteria bacterium]|nr:hypothetical protein [Acidobacteriota bacterium]